MTLIKDTVYSLNGSSRNSVSVNPVSIELNYLSQLSFLNHSGMLIELDQKKDIMITMRDIWTSNLEG